MHIYIYICMEEGERERERERLFCLFDTSTISSQGNILINSINDLKYWDMISCIYIFFLPDSVYEDPMWKYWGNLIV